MAFPRLKKFLEGARPVSFDTERQRVEARDLDGHVWRIYADKLGGVFESPAIAIEWAQRSWSIRAVSLRVSAGLIVLVRGAAAWANTMWSS